MPSPLGRIRPKISTMPRQQSEASAYLDTYKLVVERKRLQQELQQIEQRRRQIDQRMVELDQQINDLETKLQQMRSASPVQPQLASPKTTPLTDEGFNTLFLEY